MLFRNMPQHSANTGSLLLTAVLVIAGAVASCTISSEIAVDRWAEDLEFLRTALPEMHPLPFRNITDKEWNVAIDQLIRELPSLTEEEAFIRLIEVVASLDDSHTVVHGGPTFNPDFYPLWLWWFGEELRVIGVFEEAVVPGELVGARVLEIGGIPLKQVLTRLDRIVANENAQYLRLASETMLLNRDVLQALGLVRDGVLRLTVRGENGERFTARLSKTVSSEAYSAPHKWLWANKSGRWPRYFNMHHEGASPNFWLEYLRDGQALYFRYASCTERELGSGDTSYGRTYDEVAQEVLDFIATHPIDRVIIDLRGNGGGTMGIADELFRKLSRATDVTGERIDQRGRLFVLIDGGTYSAAVRQAARLAERTNAILLGEPTAGPPNFFADPKPIVLPNSHITVTVSTVWSRNSQSRMRDDALIPDHIVGTTFEDFINGTDPVLEAALGFSETR